MTTMRKESLYSLRCFLHLVWFGVFLQSGVEAFSGVRDTSAASSLSSQLRVPRKRIHPVHLSRRNAPEEYVSFLAHQKMENSQPEGSELSSVQGVSNEGGSIDRTSKYAVFGTLFSTLACLCIAAKTGFLPGIMDTATGLPGDYTDAMILRDLGSAIFSASLAFILVKLIGYGYEKGWYDSKVSRKISHTFLAPSFILVYPIFSAAEGARFFAAVVTLTNAIRLYLSALGTGDDSLARSVSRSGDKLEAIGGPLIYALQVSIFILAFWRSSLIGIVAISTMAAGDGMADLVGRRWGRTNKWWFSDEKSLAGTTAFVISASLTSISLVQWLQYTGCLQIGMDPTNLALRIVGISIVCALVELLPFVDDNVTVPLSAATLAALFLR